MNACTISSCQGKPGPAVHSDDASGGQPLTPGWRTYIWGSLAALTCPCHFPLLAAVLAGTSVGAFVGDHWGLAALALTGLFLLSMTRVLRVFGTRE